MASISRLFRSKHSYQLSKSKLSVFLFKRNILSAAYSCSNIWESRKQNPVLKDLDVYDFIGEINRQLHKGNFISPIDVDTLFSCVNDSEQFDEALRILYKFRHSPKAADIFASTHSTFVRACMKFGGDEILLKILDDPINYGIFLDSHDANILMDHFLKNGNHRDAAKIASKIMLQEDFQQQSTCWLGALSCLKWIKEPQPVDAPAEQSGDAMEDEVIFRFPFLKNRYYDDHFDIEDYHALFGKTLAWLARNLPNKELSLNLMALGYGIKKDYKQLIPVLRRQLETKTKFYAELKTHVLKTATEDDAAGSEAKAEEKPVENQSKESDKDLEEVEALVSQFDKAGLVIQEDLEQSLLEELSKILPDMEKKDVEERTKLLENWNQSHTKKIENQVFRYLKQERLKEIEKERKTLQDMEEYFNFFQNRTKLEISVHPELLRQEKEAAEKLKREEHKIPDDDKYVVPELSTKKTEEKVSF